MTTPKIASLDHFVLTVADIAATVAFYRDAMRFGVESFGEGRVALTFGAQKINLHQAGAEFEPKAATPTRGWGDFCLLSETPIAEVAGHLQGLGIEIEVPASQRTGATGPIWSIYFRDPDGNLVEVSNPL